MSLRLPLAALRESLHTEHDCAYWSLSDGPAPERTLTLAADAELVYAFALDAGVVLHATVRLPEREWLDGSGELTAWAAVGAADGPRRHVAQVRLAAAAALGLPEGAVLSARIPADATELVLGVSRGEVTDGRAVAHAEWVEPALVDDRPVDPAPPAPATPPAAGAPGARPRFSVLTPVHDPPPAMLEQTIASVRAQTWPDWELCLADDGSRDPEVRELLRRHAADDPRITLVRHEHAGGISAATNLALGQATGDYVVALDHDDTLTPEALAVVAARLRVQPDLDLVYSDEAIVEGDRVAGVYRKPGWGLEGLQCLPYAHHLGACRTALVRELGGLRSRFDGCQDYDLELRIAERTDRVAHLPQVLYRWHAHAASTAGGELAKPWAYLRQRDALAEHLARLGVDADVQFGGRTGVHRIVHRVDPTRPVTLVCAATRAEGLAEALSSWTSGPHRAWDAVIAAPAASHGQLREALRAAGIDVTRVSLVAADDETRPSAGLAAAAAGARGELLLLMPAPCIALDRDCLTRLLGYAALEGVGAAGGVVHAADGRIAEAGIALPDGLGLPRLRGLPSSQAGQLTVNVAAVDTVLATSRTAYAQTGGLDPAAGPLALVDYAWRGGERGRRAVVLGDVRVRAPAGAPLNDLAAIRRLRSQWAAAGGRDPHHHPDHRVDRADLSLA